MAETADVVVIGRGPGGEALAEVLTATAELPRSARGWIHQAVTAVGQRWHRDGTQ